MTIKVQKKKPIRTCTRTYASYISFKPYIRADFNKRCGYCDDLDVYHGGSRGYQIDHFKPHSIARFLALKEEYSNLVYSCPFCNRAKSNKWKENGFIDPCTNLYNDHLERCNNGKIKYRSLRGKYIYENLNFHLKRHELLWMIEKIIQQKKALLIYKKSLNSSHSKYIEIIEKYIEYDEKLIDYINLFHGEL